MSNDTGLVSGGISLRHILQKHEEQLMDFDKNICLLCKRVFKNNDKIKRHRSLSKLHSVRLKKLRQRLFSEEQLDRMERKEREILYRDRAKERRLKYGQTDKIIPIEPLNPNLPTSAKTTLLQKPIDTSAKPIGRDNKGAELLTKMGWREGSGLGKSNEGMTDILQLDAQVGTSGLGSRNHKIDSNLSYKEAVKKVMYQRYHELSSPDDEGG